MKEEVYQREDSHILASEHEGNDHRIPFFLIKKQPSRKKKKKTKWLSMDLNFECIKPSLYRSFHCDYQCKKKKNVFV